MDLNNIDIKKCDHNWIMLDLKYKYEINDIKINYYKNYIYKNKKLRMKFKKDLYNKLIFVKFLVDLN